MKRQDLNFSDKAIFDNCIHKVVAGFQKNPHLSCYSFAVLGSVALNKITGTLDFFPQSGGRVRVAAAQLRKSNVRYCTQSFCLEGLKELSLDKTT